MAEFILIICKHAYWSVLHWSLVQVPWDRSIPFWLVRSVPYIKIYHSLLFKHACSGAGSVWTQQNVRSLPDSSSILWFEMFRRPIFPSQKDSCSIIIPLKSSWSLRSLASIWSSFWQSCLSSSASSDSKFIWCFILRPPIVLLFLAHSMYSTSKFWSSTYFGNQ